MQIPSVSRTALTVLLLLPAAVPATAQGPAEALQPGQLLRIERAAGGPATVGHLVRLTADSVAVSPLDEPEAVEAIPNSDVGRLWVGRGPARKTLEGVALGAVTGFALGAAVGAVTWEPCTGWCIVHPDSRAQAGLWGGALLAGPGALVGAVIGALTVRERWELVPANASLQTTGAPGGGLALAVRVGVGPP
jgi:hypothetical protein